MSRWWLDEYGREVLPERWTVAGLHGPSTGAQDSENAPRALQVGVQLGAAVLGFALFLLVATAIGVR